MKVNYKTTERRSVCVRFRSARCDGARSIKKKNIFMKHICIHFVSYGGQIQRKICITACPNLKVDKVFINSFNSSLLRPPTLLQKYHWSYFIRKQVSERHPTFLFMFDVLYYIYMMIYIHTINSKYIHIYLKLEFLSVIGNLFWNLISRLFKSCKIRENSYMIIDSFKILNNLYEPNVCLQTW